MRRTHRAWLAIGLSHWTYAWHKAREAAVRADALKGFPEMSASLQACRDELAAERAEKAELLSRLAHLDGHAPSSP